MKSIDLNETNGVFYHNILEIQYMYLKHTGSWLGLEDDHFRIFVCINSSIRIRIIGISRRKSAVLVLNRRLSRENQVTIK